jgi:hypothetical protein
MTKTMKEALNGATHMSKIQYPSLGRVVEFTARKGFCEFLREEERVTYAGLVVGVHLNGVVDIVTFGPNSVHHNNRVAYHANGEAMTWRYPPRCDATLDVSEDGTARGEE